MHRGIEELSQVKAERLTKALLKCLQLINYFKASTTESKTKNGICSRQSRALKSRTIPDALFEM